MNKKIKKYLDEIAKTEKKIADLQQYLRGVQAALKQEEDNEMIRCIRGMKMENGQLYDLLDGIQNGTIKFQVSRESDEEGSGSFVFTKENKEEYQNGEMEEMNKKMAGLLLGVMMLFTASTTAFAYVDESAEASKVETIQTEQSTDKEEKKDEATNTNEVLPEDGTDKGTAFTTPGNGEVKDDITDDSTKEFLTVTTKNNNTFYIVIDRSATSQNVYMLSQIDENDLSEFLDKDSTATVVTPQPDKSKVVLDETNNEDIDKEATIDPEKTASAKTNMGAMATILILALGGVAAYYYFKIYKPKKEEDEDDQPEGLETGGLEEVPDEEESEDEDFEENEK